MFSPSIITFLSGGLLGIAFAPVHFLPAIISLSILLKRIADSQSVKDAFKQGYLFGFGFFLTLLYWIAIGVSVYADKFWWAIPFVFFGLPIIMGFLLALTATLTYLIKDKKYIHIGFCIIWVFFEWVSSWALTGFPWGLLGYISSFSLTVMQSASIIGVYGLSFIVIYLGSMFYTKHGLTTRLTVNLIILISIIIYGFIRINQNPTQFSDLTVRIVQPSIPQSDKWVSEEVFNNIEKHINLSIQPFQLTDGKSTQDVPDIIVWSEAALTIPYYYRPVFEQLIGMLEGEEQVLISGGVTDNGLRGEGMEIYSSLIALNSLGELEFEYHKSHLVPFGEYIPLGKYIPLDKITPGLQDYTRGNYEIVTLNKKNIKIKPQICYESIFPDEAAVNAAEVDLIVNVTNDSWYGNSSGPYQHFQIARMRAIENALPLIRAANNGISAIIDPVGRIVSQTNLNEVISIDNYLPLKLSNTNSLYYQYRYIFVLILVTLVLLLQTGVDKILKNNRIS